MLHYFLIVNNSKAINLPAGTDAEKARLWYRTLSKHQNVDTIYLEHLTVDYRWETYLVDQDVETCQKCHHPKVATVRWQCQSHDGWLKMCFVCKYQFDGFGHSYLTEEYHDTYP